MKVADLDADGVYWGVMEREPQAGDVVFEAEAIRPDERLEGATYLAGECDLPAGRYRWTGSVFAPLNAPNIAAPTVPSAERALYDYLADRVAKGEQLPAYARQWHEWFSRSVDNQGG
jgi:hypothetical protein